MTKPKTAPKTAQDLGLVNNPNQHVPQIKTGALDINDIQSIGKLKFDVLSDKTVTLSTDKAAEYIDLPIFQGEREVSDTHVQFLYDEMRRGTFNPLLVMLSTALYENAVYKINGQHTCWAVINMPKTFSMQVREIRYRVTSKDQLKILYSTYDRLKARTDSHVAKVFLSDTAASEGIWSSNLSRLASGFAFWFIESPAIRTKTAPEQIASTIQYDHAELFRTVALFVQEHYQDKLALRQPCIAAMFATFERVPTKAAEFWGPVLTGLDISTKTDPRKILRDTFDRVSTRISSSDRRYMNNEDLYRVCLNAWNKWRKSESVKATLRAPDTRPKVI